MARIKIEYWNATDWQDMIFQVVDTKQFKLIHFIDGDIYNPEFNEKKETENNDGIEIIKFWKLEKEHKIVFTDIEPVAYSMKILPSIDYVYITDKQGDRIKVRVTDVDIKLKSAAMYNITIKYVIDTLLKTGCETNKTIS